VHYTLVCCENEQSQGFKKLFVFLQILDPRLRLDRGGISLVLDPGWDFVVDPVKRKVQAFQEPGVSWPSLYDPDSQRSSSQSQHEPNPFAKAFRDLFVSGWPVRSIRDLPENYCPVH
jgi:hypothetical protein